MFYVPKGDDTATASAARQCVADLQSLVDQQHYELAAGVRELHRLATVLADSVERCGGTMTPLVAAQIDRAVHEATYRLKRRPAPAHRLGRGSHRRQRCRAGPRRLLVADRDRLRGRNACVPTLCA